MRKKSENTSGTTMKNGDEVKCPFCDKDSFAVKGMQMDGWTVKGEILKCSSCGKKLADILKHTEADKQLKSDIHLDNLASFLGTEKVIHTKMESDGEKVFCKDCKHYIKHPFLNRCALHTKEVDPMNDCADFMRISC